jgi:GNAT superfamily N-acetyltransferase
VAERLPGDLRLRLAGPADIDPVVDLVESAYRGDASRVGWTTEADLLDGRRTDADAVGELVSAPGALLVLAEQAGGLVGCYHLRRELGASAYFGMFAVRPDVQGRGIGAGLLDDAERRALEELGASRIYMTVLAQRHELIAFYGRRGFTATGETRPFPHVGGRFGVPRVADLVFVVLAKSLAGEPGE